MKTSAEPASTSNESQPQQSKKMSDVAALKPIQDNSRAKVSQHKKIEPATVLQMAQALDLSKFPKVRRAKNAYLFDSGLNYETSADLKTTIAAISDEFVKRGFVESESLPLGISFLVLKLEDLPASINLTSVLSDGRTHVTLHKHEGVDTSAVPTLGNASRIDERDNQVYYHSPIEIKTAHRWLRSEVESRNIPIERTMLSTGVAKVYQKDGLKFVATIRDVQREEFAYPDSDESKRLTSVAIYRRGNVGFDDLPVPSQFESVYRGHARAFGSAKFIANLTAAGAGKLVAQMFTKAGWKSAEPIRQSISDTEHLFVKNGTMVQVRATQFNAERAHVEYILSMIPFDIPNEIETNLLRVDTAAPQMFFSSTAGLTQLRQFYDELLPKLGWKPVASNQVDNDQRFAQLYYGSYHQPVALDITSQKNRTTWVELRPVNTNEVPGLFRAEATKEVASNENEQDQPVTNASDNTFKTIADVEALARSQMEKALQSIPAEDAAELRIDMKDPLNSMLNNSDSVEDVATVQDAKGAESGPKQTVLGDRIAAEDFPVPDGAKRVKRDFEMISFSVAELSNTVKFLHEKLTGEGWKPRGEQMVESDYAFMKFQKGVGTIDISLMLDERRDPPVRVIAQGDGIWFSDSEVFSDDEIAFEGEMDGEEFTADSSFEMRQEQHFEGLPLPPGVESTIRGGSRFRTELTTNVESDLKTVHNHFLNSAPATEWRITAKQLEAETAQISMASQRGELNIELKKYDGEVEIKMAFRDPQLAQEMGMVPPQGKARLILANVSKSETTITINGKVYRLAAEQGARNPKEGIQVDVLPGKYNYSITGTGREKQSDKLNVLAGGSWGLLVLPEMGHMAEQMY